MNSALPPVARPARTAADHPESAARWRHAAAAAMLAVALLVAVGGRLLAQTNADGAIIGRVGGDGRGTVAVQGLANGIRRTATVAPDGTYRIASLPPGSYKVTHTSTAGVPSEEFAEVRLGSGTVVDFSQAATRLEKYVVTGSISPIDFAKTESASLFTDKVVQELPVGRSTTAISLLTPGTTQGDVSFGLTSFSGSSVAENGYYVNGFNISNIRTGLTPTVVPFEFYEQIEVKNEAYAADYGRSTGGVINGSTKRGTNTFKAGVSVYTSPDRLTWKNANSSYQDSVGATQVYRYTGHTWDQTTDANLYVSGPILKDKLFYYGLYQVRDSRSRSAGATTFSRVRNDSPFWGGKIDFQPIKGHHFEATGFSDKRDQLTDTYAFAFATKTIGAYQRTTTASAGGENYIFRYTGNLTDQLSFSALYGWNKYNQTSLSNVDDTPLVVDARVGAPVTTRSGNGSLVTRGDDQRKALRADLEYSFNWRGSNRLRAGFDRENNTEVRVRAYSGGVYWRYVSTIPGYTLPTGGYGVREIIYRGGGSYAVKNRAYYLEDRWSTLDDRLLVRLGIRDEGFENFNSKGESFIKIPNQWAPRFGASYDLLGDRRVKVFANYGRYMLPIAAITNARLAGGEFQTQDFYLVNSINTDWTPVKGAKVGNSTVFADGSTPDPATIVDTGLQSMYQDEFVLGVQRALNKSWTVGIKGIYRNLVTAIDDVIADYGLGAWAKRNNMALKPGAHAYVLANPGRPLSFKFDVNGDGKLEEVSLSSADIGLPAAVRKYYAIELNAERNWDNKWRAQFTYTWSHNYGNTEGWVKSDNGQTDAGITSAFDSIGLMEGSYGNLPNDRRHQFKAFGTYALTSEVRLGLTLRYSSGRPKNIFSFHPTETIAQGYGAEAFYTPDGKLVPRGSLGFTKWVLYNDLSATYRPKWGRDKLSFNVSITNVMNYHTVTEIVEQATESTGQRITGAYGMPAALQSPRSIRLGMTFDY